MSVECPLCGASHAMTEGIKILTSHNLVMVDELVIKLTDHEIKIFEVLVRRAPHVVTDWALYETIYDDPEYAHDPRIIAVFISKIRRKLKGTSLEGRVSTIWGKGHAFGPKQPFTVVNALVDEPGVAA
jgi:DNA-binding response OmpR family regulator